MGGDFKDAPGAQALSVHNSQDVHNIVDPLPPGEHPGVKVLPTPEQIRDLYNQLTQNATPLPPGSYGYGQGEWAVLPDGTKIGYRPTSKFGGPTTEIWYPDGTKTDVHLPKEEVPKPQPAPQPAPQPTPVQTPAPATTQEPQPVDPGQPAIHMPTVEPPPPGVLATIGAVIVAIGKVLVDLAGALEGAMREAMHIRAKNGDWQLCRRSQQCWQATSMVWCSCAPRKRLVG